MVSTSGPSQWPPPGVVDALVPAVVAAVPEVAGWVAATPAAVLGRLAVPVDPAEERANFLRNRRSDELIARDWPLEGRSDVANALARVREPLAERILGAVELRVAGLILDPPPPAGALAELAGPPRPDGEFTMLTTSTQSEPQKALSWVEIMRPGTTPLVDALARALAARPEVAVHLQVGPEISEEEAIVARLGAAYLALAVVTATAVLRATDAEGVPDPAGVVGVALGVAVRLLSDNATLPPHFADAQLLRRRAEYRLPFHASGWTVFSQNHQLALVEGAAPAAADFSANGLVAPVADGVVVRTGSADGPVNVELLVTEDVPAQVELIGWDEVVDVSWTAPSGSAGLVGSGMGTGTPPWPGEYRVRVSARGRDRTDGGAYVRFHVWAAPLAPQTVHKTTDLLGYRLRGEITPVRPDPPETPHLWILKTSLQVAATVTVVTGASIGEVLRAFGADPAQAMSLRARREIYDIDPPCVAVTPVDGGVAAVEDNGWAGSERPVLEALSQSGRAASMFWNVNAVTRLSFAENGRLLASFEPGFGEESAVPPEVAEALQGIDFEDYRDRVPKCLAAAFRFTGVVFGPDDLARIEAADLVYPIRQR